MTDATPTSAYALLETREREIVDEYFSYLVHSQNQKQERIALAINYPIDANYLKRSRGILARPLVKAALAEKINERAMEEDLSPARVIKEHATIAFSNMFDFIEPKQFGEWNIKDLNQIPRDKMAAVKTIKTKAGLNGISTEVVMHDKITSLKILAELMGLIASDKPPALGEYSAPVKTKEVENAESNPEEVYSNLLESL